MLAFTAREDNEVEKTAAQNALRSVTETDSGVGVRQMGDADLERILELRSIVRWSADPRAFSLLRGVRDARWAVAEAPDGETVRYDYDHTGDGFHQFIDPEDGEEFTHVSSFEFSTNF